MKTIRIDRPSEWDHCNVYVLADEHIGDPCVSNGETVRRIEQIKNDPYGLCVLNGDLLNTATKMSVSDVYSENMNPMEQISAMVQMLMPIRDKIIACTCGNHEARVYKTDGVDIMRLICRQISVEDRYAPEGILTFLRFGEDDSGHHHRPILYSIYSTHGSGGGRKEGSKANRLAEMSSIVDADLFLHAHTHTPMVIKNGFYRVCTSNSSVQYVEHTFVNTAASLEYGGYGQIAEFKPSSRSNPVIRLDGRKHNVRVIM